MTTKLHGNVGGETVADLMDALQGLEFEPTDDGMVAVDGLVGPPATRAIMRLEAELLLADADALKATSRCERTDEQRRSDAVALLFDRLMCQLTPPST